MRYQQALDKNLVTRYEQVNNISSTTLGHSQCCQANCQLALVVVTLEGSRKKGKKLKFKLFVFEI